MRVYCLALCFAVGLVNGVHAQLEVMVNITPKRAILHEPTIAEIRIRNNTSETLTLRDDTPGSRLWVDIEHGPGRKVRQLAPEILTEPLVIPPRETVTHRINLAYAYDLRQQGAYTVRVRANAMGQAFVATRAFLDVVPGLEYDRRSVMFPDGSGGRVYRLMTVNRDRGETLLLRVDDASGGVCFGVIALGSFIRMHSPDMQIDAEFNAATVHQAGPGRYLYHVVNPNARVVSRRAYTSEMPGVRLVEGQDGRFVVSGATASIVDTD